ncbi:MAG: hypothetical protein ACOY0S_02185 [Patescibacteria group bacterium]
MTATAHALVAGAIASRFSDPVTASALAFTSHFIMDTVPHWDFGTDWRTRPKPLTGMAAISETLFGLSLSFSLFWPQVGAGVLIPTLVASVLPDWLETPWYIFFATHSKFKPGPRASFWEKLCFRIYKTENIFHAKTALPLGILTQVAVVAFFLFLLR